MLKGYEDLFVGSTAVLLGLFLLYCAVTNWEWYYTLRSARWLQKRFGRSGARIAHALLGCGLIALGIVVALGYRWQLL